MGHLPHLKHKWELAWTQSSTEQGCHAMPRAWLPPPNHRGAGLRQGMGHFCHQLPSTLIRVTKQSQTRGLPCPAVPHTAPQQRQPGYPMQGRRLYQPGCLPPGGAGVQHHPQSQKEPPLLHDSDSKLQALGFQGRKELRLLMEPFQTAGPGGRRMRAASEDTARPPPVQMLGEGGSAPGSDLPFPQAPSQSLARAAQSLPGQG